MKQEFLKFNNDETAPKGKCPECGVLVELDLENDAPTNGDPGIYEYRTRSHAGCNSSGEAPTTLSHEGKPIPQDRMRLLRED